MTDEEKKTKREEAKQARREEKEKKRKEKQEAKKKEREALKEKIREKDKKGWFQKIPTDIILSPAGMILIFFAIVMEIVDLIPFPVVDQLWELPFEIVFIILLTVLAKVPLKASVIPFLIERIPMVSDILPTWVIRMLV